MAEKTDTKKPKGDYFDGIAQAMRDSGITNPRELPDLTVEAVKRAHGL